MRASIHSFVLLLAVFFVYANTNASPVTLKGKVTFMTGYKPSSCILHSTADEGYVGTANVDKDGNFSFDVDVAKAGQFNFRIMRVSYDLILSAAERTTTLNITFDGENLKDISTPNSPENDVYKAFRTLTNLYDTKIITHFRDCDKEDSCEKVLHDLLSEYAHELSLVQKKYKGTYTADVLCTMRMPPVSKSVKNTTEELRKNFFSNVDFSDSTIFATPVYKEMVSLYVNYIVENRLSKEGDFVTYFTDKIKANPVVLRKSAGLFFEELMKGQREKMLAMYISWYNTGDNKKMVNNPVLDVRLKNISKVMPGQPYINISAPDTSGTMQTLKDVVDKSKCTMLLFWSSDCSHCRDEMPYIKEYYQKYHSQGLGIYAVSIEQNPEKWKTFVAEKKLAWTNVISNDRSNSGPAIQYVSVSTPTMVLIDSKGNIIHRFVPKNRLEKHIIEALK